MRAHATAVSALTHHLTNWNRSSPTSAVQITSTGTAGPPAPAPAPTPARAPTNKRLASTPQSQLCTTAHTGGPAWQDAIMPVLFRSGMILIQQGRDKCCIPFKPRPRTDYPEVNTIYPRNNILKSSADLVQHYHDQAQIAQSQTPNGTYGDGLGKTHRCRWRLETSIGRRR